MGKSHIFKKKSNDFLLGRNDIVTIPFENKDEMIQLVAEHLSYQYKKTFRDLREKKLSEYRRKTFKSKKLVEALKFLLNKKMSFFKRVTITNKSKILKKAFEIAKIEESPETVITEKRIFKIKGLEFQIIKIR